MLISIQNLDNRLIFIMRVVDIFCGAGGWSEGLRQVGCEVVAGINRCKHCCRSYTANQGVACHQLDLLTEDGVQQALQICANADVIVSSPPCQSYSQANKYRCDPGHQEQYATSNNTLPAAFARIVAGCEPKCVVFEQVPLFKHTAIIKMS
jgi:DNA (cytosine-5)-methyltransferase 1